MIEDFAERRNYRIRLTGMWLFKILSQPSPKERALIITLERLSGLKTERVNKN
jgi:hypothetical protein